MKTSLCFIVTLLFGFGLVIPGLAEQGGEPSEGNFPKTITKKFGDQEIKLSRTGTTIRHRRRIQVYKIASYVQEGVKVESAAELLAADCPKQLHLVMLRYVPAGIMANAFETALRINNPEPKFAAELKMVTEFFQKAGVERGEHIWLSHIPKVGFHCRRQGGEVLVRNAEFSKAVWGTYFSKRNVEEGVRQGLLSEL